jgi:hypothetical protein
VFLLLTSLWLLENSHKPIIWTLVRIVYLYCTSTRHSWHACQLIRALHHSHVFRWDIHSVQHELIIPLFPLTAPVDSLAPDTTSVVHRPFIGLDIEVELLQTCSLCVSSYSCIFRVLCMYVLETHFAWRSQYLILQNFLCATLSSEMIKMPLDEI